MENVTLAVPELFKTVLKFRPATPPLVEGSWFGGLAFKGKDDSYYLVAGKLFLLERGTYPPDLTEGRLLFKDGVVSAVTILLDETQTHQSLEFFSRAKVPPFLQDAFGVKVLIAEGRGGQPANWYSSGSAMDSGSAMSLGGKYAKATSQRNPRELADYVDEQVFDGADMAFRFMESPMDGVRDFVERLSLRGGSSFSSIHEARDALEVHAELPLLVKSFEYDYQAGGYKIKVLVGARLPREQFKFSITGPVPCLLSLAGNEWRLVEGDVDSVLVYECIIASDHKAEPLNWRLALNGESVIGKGVCAGRPSVDALASTSRKVIIPGFSQQQKIELPYGEWFFYPNKKLGKSGGFGDVFEGTDLLKRPLAVKVIKAAQEDAAQREIEVARKLVNHKKPHVIPIFDAGRDASSGQYFVVMARAQQNLQELVDRGGAVPESEAVSILRDIVSGLEELGTSIHRDLKPANVLLHEEAWKIADLGLVRTDGAETGAHTVRDFMTREYAAPEQWVGDRATKKTDVYALGCMIYTLINGRPPFGGSDEDLRQKHMFGAPDVKLAATRPMQVLAQRCLQKVQESRPSLEEIRKLLQVALEPDVDEDPIVAASALISEEKNKRNAELAAREQARKSREQMSADVALALRERMDVFFQDIVEKSMGTAARKPDGVALGSAVLAFHELDFKTPVGLFAKSGWDVVVGACVVLAWKRTETILFGGHFSANLWFAKRPGDLSYRWWEVGYVENRKGEDLIHFGTETPRWLEAIDCAMAGMKGELIVVGTPVPADLESEAAFLFRWRKRLADASMSLVSAYRPEW